MDDMVTKACSFHLEFHCLVVIRNLLNSWSPGHSIKTAITLLIPLGCVHRKLEHAFRVVGHVDVRVRGGCKATTSPASHISVLRWTPWGGLCSLLATDTLASHERAQWCFLVS